MKGMVALELGVIERLVAEARAAGRDPAPRPDPRPAARRPVHLHRRRGGRRPRRRALDRRASARLAARSRRRSTSAAACRVTVGGRRLLPDPGRREGLRPVPDPRPRDVGPRLDAPRRQRRGPRRRRSSSAWPSRADPHDAGHGALPRARRPTRCRRDAARRLRAPRRAASCDSGRRPRDRPACATRCTHGRSGRCIRDTLSPNIIHAGVKYNVIPGDAMVEVDCRVLPGTTERRHPRRARTAHRPRPRCRPAEIERLVPARRSRRRPRARSGTPSSRLIRDHDPDGIPLPVMAPFATDAKARATLGTPTYGFSPLRPRARRALPRALPRRRRAGLARGPALRAAGPLRRRPPLLRLNLSRRDAAPVSRPRTPRADRPAA